MLVLADLPLFLTLNGLLDHKTRLEKSEGLISMN